MGEAFEAPKLSEDAKTGQKMLKIKNNDLLTNRNAIKYLALTLQGAVKARMLSMNRGVEFVDARLSDMPTIFAK